MPDAVKKVALAYSGGLDTSMILRWLQETYRSEVVTFTADLGQGRGARAGAPQGRIARGARDLCRRSARGVRARRRGRRRAIVLVFPANNLYLT
jgi:argininosuccinate synthase